jgi:type I restriction enzyme M protein
LFIDARQMGSMVTRTVKELSDDEIAKIADTYNAWRGEPNAGPYEDVPGFCSSVSSEDIRINDHVLTPGRYVGVEDSIDDGEPLDIKLQRLIDAVEGGFTARGELQNLVSKSLASLRSAEDA